MAWVNLSARKMPSLARPAQVPALSEEEIAPVGQSPVLDRPRQLPGTPVRMKARAVEITVDPPLEHVPLSSQQGGLPPPLSGANDDSTEKVRDGDLSAPLLVE